MKSRIAIIGISVLGIAAISGLAFQDQTNDGKEPVFKTQASEVTNDFIDQGFFYKVYPRFHGISKSDLAHMTSIHDFLPENSPSIMTFNSVKIVKMIGNEWSDDIAEGTTEAFNDEQLQLLQSFDYSTNFFIRADFDEYNGETGKMEPTYATPHHTVIPEKQAVYENGKDAFKNYLIAQSKEETAKVDTKQLKSGRIYFTVNTKGSIEGIKLLGTSGYIYLDELMMRLIYNAPGTWTPAENASGEKVNQELTFTFGQMGC